MQLVFYWAPKLARKCESKHWFPCGADGRSGVQSRDYQIFLAMRLPPRARFAHGWSSAKMKRTDDCVSPLAKKQYLTDEYSRMN